MYSFNLSINIFKVFFNDLCKNLYIIRLLNLYIWNYIIYYMLYFHYVIGYEKIKQYYLSYVIFLFLFRIIL